MKSTSSTVCFALLGLFLVLQATSATSSESGSKVKVDVYYETLCPDSIGFLIRKLIPNYEAISSMIQLNLVPFGKAEIYEYNGSTDFYCQHGPKECRGNMLHACALEEYRNTSQVLPFIDCMEYELYGKSRPNIDLIAKKCAQQKSLDWSMLEECAGGAKGKELLKAAGKKTKAVRPKVTFVPTVILDDTYTQSNQDKALYGDFVQLICNKYSGSSKASTCTSSSEN